MISQVATKISTVYGEWHSKQIARGLLELAVAYRTPDQPEGAPAVIGLGCRITITGQPTKQMDPPMTFATVEEAERMIAEKLAAAV